MELMGVTYEYTYTRAPEQKNTSENSERTRDDREFFPWPAPGHSRYKLPWRTSTYCMPAAFDQGRCSKPESNAQETAGIHPPSPLAEEQYVPAPPREKKICCTHKFVPLRRVLVGGKFKVFPDREEPKSVHFDPCARIPETQTVTEETCEQQNEAGKTPTLPVIGRDPDLPMTPPLGRAARLEAFIHARQDELLEKGTLAKPPCFPTSPFYVSRHPVTAQEDQTERKKISEASKHDRPISLFRYDQKILDRTLRTFKRDKELQKERGQYEDPKKWDDEGAKEWYNMMMLNNAPRVDEKKESELIRSDCVRIEDGLGGHCYVCPKQGEGESLLNNKNQKDGGAPNPDCQNMFKTTIGTRKPCKQTAIQKEIDTVVIAAKKEAEERECLYQRLIDTEQPFHQAKQKYYSMPYEERLKDSALLQRIQNIEKSQSSLVEAIRNKGRKLSELLKQQHGLQCQLTYQILQDERQ